MKQMEEKEGIERDKKSLEFTLKDMKKEVKALIARDIFSRNEFFKIFYQDDDAILKALDVLENKEKYNHLLVAAE